MDAFNIEFQKIPIGGGLVLLSGSFRNLHVQRFYDTILPRIPDLSVIILDLADLDYIDSSGIAAIIGLSRRLSARSGGHLALCSVQEGVSNVFRTMKLYRLFPFHKDRNSALQAENLLDKENTTS